MQFLSPWFLVGALAIGLPIFLHLFQKEKKSSLSFASLMFLRRLPVKQTRRRRLKYLLLLALRCLAFLLIVAAFARPVATGAWLNVNPLAARSVVILIDRSMSVSQTSAWQESLRAARNQIQSLGEGDEGMIIQFGQLVQTVTGWETSPEILLEALQSKVRPSYESTAYTEGMRAAAEQLQEARNRKKVIFLITDLQREGLASSGAWKAPPEVTVEVHSLEAPDENLYVQQVRLNRDVFTKKYPNPILVNLSTSPPRQIEGEVQLFISGEMRDRQSFQTGENGSALLTFDPFELEEGTTRGRIVAIYADPLQADNTFHFVVERQSPRIIALIAGSKSDRDAFFLERALSAGENLPYSVKRRNSLSQVNLDPSATPLLILDNLPSLPSASAIEGYLEKGGGVIVALGDKARSEAYNQQWKDLLPARLLERRFVRSGKRPFTSMTEISWEHPAFAVFQDVYKSTISTTQFFSYWKLEALAESVVFARFSEGDPALVENAPEKPGRLILFSAGSGSAWSDFPLRSAYVPFWQAAVQYATGWSSRPAAGRINQSLGLDSWSAGDQSPSGELNVLDPQGRRVLGLDEDRPDFIRLSQPGHYEIRSNKKTDWMAANTLPFESNLESVPLEDFLAALVPPQSRGDQNLEAGEQVEAQERQQSLWWLFLLGAAAVLVLEALVANRQGSARAVAQA